MPQNAGTARRYSGINVLILWAEVVAKGYVSQRWLTYRQAETAGGKVRRGEKGTVICYADRFTPKAEAEAARGEDREARQVAFLKRFVVFNVDQCEGLPDDNIAPMVSPDPVLAIYVVPTCSFCRKWMVAMAIYHFSAKIISRAVGSSAVAAAAYRSADRLHDERLGRTHDFSNKAGVLHSELMLPDGAPEEWRDREKLWNDVEAAEIRKDAQLAREVEFAIPREMTQGQPLSRTGG